MRKPRKPQTARHIMLYDDDWLYLESRFGRYNGGLGSSAAIREKISHWVGEMKQREITQLDMQQEQERDNP